MSGSYASASGNTIHVQFSDTFTKVLYFGAIPDEYFSSKGMIIGASVGVDYADLTISVDETITGMCYYSSGMWMNSNTDGSNYERTITVPSNGIFQLNHEILMGPISEYQVSMLNNGIDLSGINTPMVKLAGNADNHTAFSFLNNSFQVDTSTSPNTNMSFSYSIGGRRKPIMDGTRGYTWGSGNIFFFGLFIK